MVAETWLVKLGSQVSHNLKHAFSLDDTNKTATVKKSQTIGILSFEIANVMSKTIHLYKSLSHQEITRIKDVFKSEGVAFLVSDNEELLLNLVFMEKLYELNRISGVVSRLGKRCSEPALQGFEHVYSDLLRKRLDFREFGFLVKDMNGVIKKMERYVSATADLYAELEALSELEQNAKKFRQNEGLPKETFRQFEQKLQWQREDVKHLRDVSLWNQTYDKIVGVLARLVCTIYARISLIFGKIDSSSPPGRCDVSGGFSTQIEPRERASSCVSGPLEKFPLEKRVKDAKSGLLLQNTELGSFRNSNCVAPCGFGPGRLFKDCLSLASSGSFRYDDAEIETQSTSSSSGSTHSRQMKNGALTSNSVSSTPQSGPIKESPLTSFDRIKAISQPSGDRELSQSMWGFEQYSKSQLGANLKNGLMNAPPSTVGGSALALHYANIIIILEKFLRYPHLVGDEAKDDLYQMLPTSLRTSLKMSLKSYTKNLASAIYDASLAHEWKESVDKMLSWLAPLAHNMIRWQTERNFEQQQFLPRTNVLLLQTLYFADRQKTEAAICELLVGLNYICRYEHQQNALLDCTSSQEFDDYMSWQLQY